MPANESRPAASETALPQHLRQAARIDSQAAEIARLRTALEATLSFISDAVEAGVLYREEVEGSLWYQLARAEVPS